MRKRGADIVGGTSLAFINSDCPGCMGWIGAVEDAMSDYLVHATGSSFRVSEMASRIL